MAHIDRDGIKHLDDMACDRLLEYERHAVELGTNEEDLDALLQENSYLRDLYAT
jgi:hypothetical protein